MIVTSKIDSKKYFWVKVPRTATYSYEKLFFPEFYKDNIVILHSHTPYFFMKDATCENKPKVDGVFTVIRHPYTRFISSLRYLTIRRNTTPRFDGTEEFLSVCEFCEKQSKINKEEFSNKMHTTFTDFLDNEDVFYDFMYSYFDKNSILKYEYSWDTILGTELTSLVSTVFKTQTYFAYHPQVKVFKYENLQEFNLWIENTLGISTKNVPKDNTSTHVNLNIDVTTKKFKDLVKYLFHDDFKLFGYNL